MADKSTNSNNSENTESTDSNTDSDLTADVDAAKQEDSDAPVVIEGEAEDVTDASEDEKAAVEETISDEAEPMDAKDDQVEQDAASEAQTEEQPETAPEPPAVVPPPAPEPKRASFLPLVGGGIIAGAIGFLVASSQPPTSAPDARFDALSAEFDALSAEIAQIAPADFGPVTERLDILSNDVAALQDAPVPTSDVPTSLIERIDALEADFASGISSVNEKIAALEDQLADFQITQSTANPVADMTEEQLAAFESQLEEMTASARAQVEEARARASEIELRAAEVAAAAERKAAEAAAAAERKAAMAALTVAVENGDAFGDELTIFDNPPAALVSAQEGVASLGALQRDFPDAARSALSVASEVPQEASASERLAAFLKRQTNARSLAPKEGDDVDAVLSRAEASVLNGDLSSAMGELAGLPDDAKEAMQPWLSQAQARLDALSALSELSSAEN